MLIGSDGIVSYCHPNLGWNMDAINMWCNNGPVLCLRVNAPSYHNWQYDRNDREFQENIKRYGFIKAKALQKKPL